MHVKKKKNQNSFEFIKFWWKEVKTGLVMGLSQSKFEIDSKSNSGPIQGSSNNEQIIRVVPSKRAIQ